MNIIYESLSAIIENLKVEISNNNNIKSAIVLILKFFLVINAYSTYE